jgi:hypothetical protein
MSYTMKIFDAGRSMLARKAINAEISQFGKIVELNINTNINKISAVISLLGEEQDVNINIQFYELIEENGRNFIKLKGIETSKEWLTIVANKFLGDKKLQIPDEAAYIL